jgi:hypothetical protein
MRMNHGRCPAEPTENRPSDGPWDHLGTKRPARAHTTCTSVHIEHVRLTLPDLRKRPLQRPGGQGVVHSRMSSSRRCRTRSSSPTSAHCDGQVRPGTRALRSSSIDELADLLRPLSAAAPAAPEFPPISGWLRERLLDDGAVDLPPDVPAASPLLVRRNANGSCRSSTI